MKLIDFVNNMDTVDEASIIFQEDRGAMDADILVEKPEEGNHFVKEHNGKKYRFLIEALSAKQFIAELKTSLNYPPTNEEIAERLYEFALNDA